MAPPPLTKSVKQFYFGGGIETKGASEATALGQLHLLQNARMDRNGVISKRYGRSAAATTVGFPSSTSPAALANVKAFLGTSKNLSAVMLNEHGSTNLQSSEDRILSYSETMNGWPDLGAANSVMVESYPIGNTNQVAPEDGALDCATDGNLICSIMRRTASTISVTLFEAQTKKTVWSGSIAAPAGYGRVVYSSVAGKFFTVTQSNSTPANLYVHEINASALTLNFVGILVTDLDVSVDTNGIYDMRIETVSGADYFFLAYQESATHKLCIRRFTSLNAITGTLVVTDAATTPAGHISVFFSGTDVCVLVCCAATVRAISYTFASVLVKASFAIYGSAATVAYGSSNAIGGLNKIFLRGSGSYGGNQIFCATWDHTSATIHPAAWQLLLYSTFELASRPFAANGRDHIFVSYVSAQDQQTLFLIVVEGGRTDPDTLVVGLVARLFYSSDMDTDGAVHHLNGRYLSSVPQIRTDEFCYNHIVLDEDAIQGPSFAAQNKQRLVFLDFSSPNNYQSRNLRDYALTTGGYMGFFDGANFTEAGFPLAPEYLVLTPSIGGGAALTLLGTYEYVLVYEWHDAAGNLHQSAPSPPATITLTGSNNVVTVTSFVSPPLVYLNSKTSFVIRVYRSTNAGTVLYAIGSWTPTGGSSFVDSFADTSITSSSILYTTGGVLPNDMLDSVTALTVWKNRVIAISDGKIYYSQALLDGKPPRFDLSLIIDLEDVGGRPKAVAALLDKLIIFKEGRIYYVTGDGPNDLGQGSLFSVPQLLDASVGCSAQQSIVETGSSVMFQAKNQYWTINSDLSISTLGSELSHFFTESTVVNNTLINDRDNEILIQTSNELFVYDYFTKQFARNTGKAAGVAIGISDTSIVSADTSGNVFFEDKTTYKDNGSAFALRVTTGWINLGAIEGYQRVWRAYFLNRFYNNHTLNINVYYDYLPKVVDTFQFVASSSNLATFTDDNVFTDTAFAGVGDPYVVRMHIKNQKCMAIRFEIFDSAWDTSSSCRALDLIGIAFELGLKRVGAKMPAARSI